MQDTTAERINFALVTLKEDLVEIHERHGEDCADAYMRERIATLKTRISVLDAALVWGWGDEEIQHAMSAKDATYGPETSIPLANGRVICVPAYPEECSYVRIVQGAHEIGYWDADEFADDPRGALGAVMGLAHGKN